MNDSLIHFGREVCGDLPAALRREWLVTNGLGGYASSTIIGTNTRTYHGLLVAALQPPVARTVLVGGLVVWASVRGVRFPLDTHEYYDGTIEPAGYRHLQSFHLEGQLPVWRYALGDALLESRLWMVNGANTTYITYQVLQASSAVELEVTPLITYRDFHHATGAPGARPEMDAIEQGVRVRFGPDAHPYQLLLPGAEYQAMSDWYWNVHFREETARGLGDRSDLFVPGRFTVSLDPGAGCALILSAEENVDLDVGQARARAEERQRSLLRKAEAESASPMVRGLILAADQFLVARQPIPGEDQAEAGGTVIAGYHWFNDWGRDTMISLPGLTLPTGRADEAARILRTFARYVQDGLLPNNFPDQSGQIPGYNTADATLWFVLAGDAYYRATGDRGLVDELLPVLRGIVAAHEAGTRYHIGVDPKDDLLHAGEPGIQLTWMDAKVGDWVVTPRIGKPVEINALWYNVLCCMAAFLKERHDPGAARLNALAERTRASFRSRFLSPGRPGLADVLDGPEGDDWSVRPNQIFAVSLPHRILEPTEEAAVVVVVGQHLLTSYGLRSLSPSDPVYKGRYGSDVQSRDGAYHEGTAWSWLLGPYAEAHFRVYGDAAAALAWLAPLQDHLADAGLGSISEIFDGDAPHAPRGCIAQAWSVAETLRVWRALEERKTR
ncbi:MAG: amylo-alpha-1,6-glucosidase [Chloroflexota bacterium]